MLPRSKSTRQGVRQNGRGLSYGEISYISKEIIKLTSF